MSTKTVDEIAVLARNRLTQRSEAASGITHPQLVAMVPDGLDRVARQIAASDDYRELQKEITTTAVAGKYLIADATLIIESIPSTGLVLADGVLCRWAPRYDALTNTLPTDCPWIALRNQTLYIKEQTTGQLGTYAGVLTILASYIPTLALLPEKYVSALVDQIVMVAIERAMGGPPPAAHPTKDRAAPPPIVQVADAT